MARGEVLRVVFGGWLAGSSQPSSLFWHYVRRLSQTFVNVINSCNGFGARLLQGLQGGGGCGGLVTFYTKLLLLWGRWHSSSSTFGAPVCWLVALELPCKRLEICSIIFYFLIQFQSHNSNSVSDSNWTRAAAPLKAANTNIVLITHNKRPQELNKFLHLKKSRCAKCTKFKNYFKNRFKCLN